MRRDATTDALTNLANRKAFDEELGRAYAEAVESGEPLSLAVIDIDHFKGFNDTWGHQTATRSSAMSPASSAAWPRRRASPPATAARSSP